MQHKVSELEGELLDAAVMKAEGGEWDWPPPYSTLWERGGLIIERERITLYANGTADWSQSWSAAAPDQTHVSVGPTALIAAMRAYCASKFGRDG